MDEITGTYTGHRWRNETFVIGNLRQQNGAVATITGEVSKAELRVGETYRLYGEWVDHPRYGRQFKFTSLAEAVPSGKNGISIYLAKLCPGIGPATAGKLYAAFGEDTLSIIRSDPDRAAEALGGTDKARDMMAGAAAILGNNHQYEQVRVSLMEMFAGWGFPRKTIETAIRKWKGRAADIIGRDPFKLITARFPGIGFLRADQMYCSRGGNRDRLKRATLAAWYACDEHSTGDTWLPIEQARKFVHNHTPGADFTRAVELGLRAGWLSTDETGRWITSRERAAAESGLAEELTRLQTAYTHWPTEIPSSDEPGDGRPTAHQVEEIGKATLGPIGILVGSPGTGKTFTLACLLRMVVSGRRPVYACAPTGKAAVRMTESLRGQGLALKARTIHSLLGVTPQGFAFSAKNQLEPGVMIVDESSMLSTPLLWALLQACPTGMHILFVGDTHQLAPVEHGAPLRDMIAAGIPCGCLSEIHRNSGTIVRVCAELKDGQPYRYDLALNPAEGRNLKHVEDSRPESQVIRLRELLRLIGDSGKDLFDDVQILCTVNRKSPIGREELNKGLQDHLNPNGATIDGCKFREGDKVICLKNSWFRSAADEATDDDEEYVANGEIGICDRVEKWGIIARFTNSDETKTVRIPLRKTEDGDTVGVVELGYAITVWKSQGSQWPIVIAMADSSAGANWIGSRELWYTAISRASSYAVTIGQRATIDKQCRTVSLPKRKTFLAEMLGEAIGELVGVTEGEVF